jgi:hypothetical protein
MTKKVGDDTRALSVVSWRLLYSLMTLTPYGGM